MQQHPRRPKTFNTLHATHDKSQRVLERQ